MKFELRKNGPFSIKISAYEDFVTYKSGVYWHKTGRYLGHHAMKVVGYGEESGVKYWLIANSWNSEWGDNGFVKIRRGQNDLGLETSGVAGLPKLK